MTMTVFHKSGKCTQRAAPYNSGMTKVPPLPLNLCIHRKNHALLSRHYVTSHPRNGNDVAQFQRRICFQIGSVGRFVGEPMPRRKPLPLIIELTHLLHDLEQPGTSRNAASLQRRHGKTDHFIRSALIGNHKIRQQRIKMPVGAFHGGVEQF